MAFNVHSSASSSSSPAPMLSASSKTFLFDLLATPSPTGFEAAGQRKWMAQVGQFADRVESDAYGSAWATLDGSREAGPRILFEAHADEIGFMVKHIAPDGFISVDRVGRADAGTARGRRVDILGDNGSVRGVIAATAIHIRGEDNEEVPKAHELVIDIGAASDKEVGQAGIRVGHPMVYADTAEQFGKDLLCGRALDNRVGSFILAEVMQRLHQRKVRLPATVHAVNAVQEEIGGNGARMVAHRLMPDVAVVLDVTHATDTPGIDHRQHSLIKLGGGPTLTHGTVNHIEVVKRLSEVAEKVKVPLQHEASWRITGTDADVIFRQQHGIPTALVSLPLRYMHSVVEVVHLADVEHTIQLLVAFAESVKAEETFRVNL